MVSNLCRCYSSVYVTVTLSLTSACGGNISKNYIYIYRVESVWFQLLGGRGVTGAALVLFSFYVNASRMRPRSRLPSQPLILPAPPR